MMLENANAADGRLEPRRTILEFRDERPEPIEGDIEEGLVRRDRRTAAARIRIRATGASSALGQANAGESIGRSDASERPDVSEVSRGSEVREASEVSEVSAKSLKIVRIGPLFEGSSGLV